MTLVSIQVESGSQVLRPFGLVNVSLGGSMMCLYNDLSHGQLETGDSYAVPEKYDNCEVSVTGSSCMTGPFQSVPMTAVVSDVIEYGKFFKYALSGRPAENMIP